MQNQILIKKFDGTEEPFDESKLRFSLARAGAGQQTINEIVSMVTSKLKPGVTTGWIYKEAFALLKKTAKETPVVAAKYSMKRAVMALGPSGFPFEKFLAEIYKRKGYKTQTGIMLAGQCVEHEIDMYAENDVHTIIAEAKYHNAPGLASDLKVALYVKARMEDLQKTVGANGTNMEGWLITNTQFTSNVIKYAKCAGLNLLSWSYPEKGNLMDLIEETKLHPITCLTSLNKQEKQQMVESGVVLCKSLQEKVDQMKALGFSEEKIQQILDESSLVCV